MGCCALAVLVRGHALYVANAGDCRAVLGKRPSAPRPPPPPTNNKGKGKAVVAMAAKEGAGAGEGYEAVALSDDHNAKLPKEMEELKRAHPGEADIVKCKHPNACYVKGRLQPTRWVCVGVVGSVVDGRGHGLIPNHTHDSTHIVRLLLSPSPTTNTPTPHP